MLLLFGEWKNSTGHRNHCDMVNSTCQSDQMESVILICKNCSFETKYNFFLNVALNCKKMRYLIKDKTKLMVNFTQDIKKIDG